MPDDRPVSQPAEIDRLQVSRCADADPEELGTGPTAAPQGGYLPAETARDIKPRAIALDMARPIGHVVGPICPYLGAQLQGLDQGGAG